jgi:tRNA G18 (ribose-2'-O)-methylase SpoU
MFHVKYIDSLDRPELQPYRTMRRPLEHRQQGIFVAEGEKVVRRLLDSRLGVVSVLVPEARLAGLAPLLQARSEEIDVYVAPKAQLERLTGFSFYQGVLAVGRIPQPPTLERLWASSPTPRLFIAADGLTSAENLGVLVRNGAAFGVQGLLVGETCSSPFLRRAVRSSMGAIFRLPAVEVDSLVEALQVLRSHGVRCVAAHPHSGRKSVSESPLASDCCLVFGSEGSGISPSVLDACEEWVPIPMQNEVDSLNVSSAGAVFLYEANRQRGRA